MAESRRIPIYGSSPYYYRIIREKRKLRSNTNNDQDQTQSTVGMRNISNNIVDYIRCREYGVREYHSFNRNYGLRHIIRHDLFKETILPINKMDEISSSLWLNNSDIMYGTKNYKLMIYNVNTHETFQIKPVISQGREMYNCPVSNCLRGISALKMNASKSWLATNATKMNEIGVYKMPTLLPIVLAKGAHSSNVKDIEWIDQEHFVSGGCDCKLAVWKINDTFEEIDDDGNKKIVPQTIKPITVVRFNPYSVIRSIVSNSRTNEIVTLSYHAINIWDPENINHPTLRPLSTAYPSFCITPVTDGNLYAIGCEGRTILLDSRSKSIAKTFMVRFSDSIIASIMSISCRDNIITLGSNAGEIYFYDIRAGKYFATVKHSRRLAVLRSQPNPLCTHINYDDQLCCPIIFSHCYDYSGTRLFSAGTSECKNYACLWQ